MQDGAFTPVSNFKFQYDSINTRSRRRSPPSRSAFKFQYDSINTQLLISSAMPESALNSNMILLIPPCSKTPLKPQVTTLISVDLRNKHLYALTS